MSCHAFHQLYYHITWSTKHRQPFIVDHLRTWLIECITEQGKKREAVVLACNTMPDHIHLLISLPPTVTVATFIGQVKGASSRLLKMQHQLAETNQVWQEGYGVVTLRKAEARKVTDYVVNQQELHAKRKTSHILETQFMEDEPPEAE
jgi:putative transposase